MSNHYLQKNECLLAQQTIKGNKKVSKDALIFYFQQKTNSTLLGMPIRLWVYALGHAHFNPKKITHTIHRIKEKYDQKIAVSAQYPTRIKQLENKKEKKIAKQQKKLQTGNWLMRIGEPPVIYCPVEQEFTEKQLKYYLQSEGYFAAQVDSKTKIINQKAYITYQIKENQPYSIQTLKLISPDPNIDQLLQPYETKSLIRKGKNYNKDILRQERERIYDVLLNHGYWDFNKQYISFQVDTTKQDKNITIHTIIALPEHTIRHQVYHIDSISFELKTPFPSAEEDRISYQDIVFKNTQHHFYPSVLFNKLPVRKGQMYKKDDIINIQKRLSRLHIFQDIHVNQHKTSTGHLAICIYADLAERFQLSNEIGLQLDTQLSKILPNPFYKLSLNSRNLFKRLESIILSTQISIERTLDLENLSNLNTNKNFNFEVNVSVPKFLFPLGNLIQNTLAKYNPVTSLKLGYDFDQVTLNRLEKDSAYIRHKMKTLFLYQWQANKYIRFELNLLSFDLIRAQLSPTFAAALHRQKAQGDVTYRIYMPSLLTHGYLKTVLEKIPFEHDKISYTSCELSVESGGITHNISNSQFFFNEAATYSNYVKLHSNFIQHINLQPGTTLAYQAIIGCIYPYGSHVMLLPYDKYYFAGGPSSNRAWYPHTLGPGSYNATKEKDGHIKLKECPGEFLLQGNIEIRRKLSSILEGAVFIDAGNVWILSGHNTHPDKKIALDKFYREIAIGVGIGTRFDFTFFLLRVDIGFKLYDPGKELGKRFLPSYMFKDFALNIGLGYPF